jgi:hypothetical protein
MNKASNHAFVNQLLVYTLVMICFSGSIGLGTVWLRHQISITANATKVLDARIADVERRINETTTVIETEQDPGVLKRRNVELHLGLVPVSQAQVVQIAGDPVMKLAAKRNRGLFTDGVVSAVVSFPPVAGLAP